MSKQLLPELPIPSLNSTKSKLIEWIRPLVDDMQLEKTLSVIESFFEENGEGEKLQQKLLEWNENQEGSWYTPFWNDLYLKHRASLPSTMNYSVLLNEDQNIKQKTMMKTVAKISSLVAEYYHYIIDEKIYDTSQANKLFRSVRIPQINRDIFQVANFDKKNNHVVLLYKNNVYKVPVTSKKGNIYNNIDITAAIEAAVTKEKTENVNVGIFTTAKRDQAAQIYKELKKSKENTNILQVIADALVIISIDEESENGEDAIKNLMLNAKNKYFDKTIQIVITKYGAIGFNIEHSAIDGTSIAPVIAHVSKGFKQNLPQLSRMSQKIYVKKMTWNLSKVVLDGLTQIEKAHAIRRSDFSLNTNFFTDFGVEQIKHLKVSPDAFFHMALQLAQNRTFGKLRSVYEPVSVRAFYEGRTESARATSMEKRNLVEAIEKASYSKEQLYALMQKASDAHSKRIKDCQQGHGIERHLYGLEQMYHLFGTELDMESLPNLFRDTGYMTLRNDFISTSGMNYENAKYWIFGPVVERGHGIAYFLTKDSISINIASFLENKREGDQLMNHLINALHELKDIAEKGKGKMES